MAVTLGVGGGVAQHYRDISRGWLNPGCRQEGIFHLSKHARDPFALITGEAQIHQGAHQPRVATAARRGSRHAGVGMVWPRAGKQKLCGLPQHQL